jgi:phage terminase Nu1 subunit (DNA packaging protein)
MGKSKAKGELLHETTILTSELAAVIGKSPQWVRQLTRDGVLKQVGRGKYILGESIQAYIEHAYGGKEEDNKPRYIDEKTELTRIKKEQAELELKRMRGELHEAEDVEIVMQDMLSAFRAKILSIPTKLSPQLVGMTEINSIQGVLKAAMREALSELSNYDAEAFHEGQARVDADEKT